VTCNVRLTSTAQQDFYRAQAHYDTEAPHETARSVAEFFTTARRRAGGAELARE